LAVCVVALRNLYFIISAQVQESPSGPPLANCLIDFDFFEGGKVQEVKRG